MQKINQCFAGLPHCPLRAAHRLITSCCLVFNEAGFLIKKKSPSPPDNLVLVLSCRPVCGYHRREVCRVLSAYARVCVFVRARRDDVRQTFLDSLHSFVHVYFSTGCQGSKCLHLNSFCFFFFFCATHTHTCTHPHARAHTHPPQTLPQDPILSRVS